MAPLYSLPTVKGPTGNSQLPNKGKPNPWPRRLSMTKWNGKKLFCLKEKNGTKRVRPNKRLSLVCSERAMTVV